MSRRDSPSFLVRGVPREVLDRLEQLAPPNQKPAFLVGILAAYAYGLTRPRAAPPPFDPNRVRNAPHAAGTAPLAINNIPADLFARFVERARADGWLSKNELIVELLRDRVADVSAGDVSGGRPSDP